MIPVKNIYYMLSYAFKTLQEQGYKDIETEEFDNIADLCGAILCRGVSLQIKRGLNREYVEKQESLTAIRGKINLSESVKTNSIVKNQLVCSFDDFSENSYLNRIIKSTLYLLIKSDIPRNRKKEIKKILLFFRNVDLIDIHSINWKTQYNRNNRSYQMLISICYLIVKGLLQTQSDGTTRLMDFVDEQRMSRLYEKFIFEYYRKEHPEIKTSSPQIEWAVDDGVYDMLPVMQTDIVINNDHNVLIIDAKYYEKSTQVYYDKQTIRSGHLYQIFAYVKNMKANINSEKDVSGMLLYAGTDSDYDPDETYPMEGNLISAKTLRLDCEFSQIKKQLDLIAKQL